MHYTYSQNVFLTKYNIIKLGDFGIAKVLDSTLSKAQTVVRFPNVLDIFEWSIMQPYVPLYAPSAPIS